MSLFPIELFLLKDSIHHSITSNLKNNIKDITNYNKNDVYYNGNHYLKEIEEHIKINSYKACNIVNYSNFKCFNEILLLLIELYLDDYDILLRIMNISIIYHLKLDHIPITIPSRSIKIFSELSIWKNPMLWKHMILEQMNVDMNRFNDIISLYVMNKQLHCVKNFQLFDLNEVPIDYKNKQRFNHKMHLKIIGIRVFLITARIQAFVTNMRSFGCSNTVIHEILHEMTEYLQLKRFHLHYMKLTPSISCIDYIFHYACEVFGWKLNEMKHLRDHSKFIYSDMTIHHPNPNPSSNPHTNTNPSSNPHTNTNPSVEFFDGRSLHTCCSYSGVYLLGYSPLLELIFVTYIELLKQNETNSNSMLSMKKSSTVGIHQNNYKQQHQQYSHGFDNTDTPSVDAEEEEQVLASSSVCICGTLIREKALWTFINRNNNHHHYQKDNKGSNTSSDIADGRRLPQELLSMLLPKMLCERCYRLLVSNPLTIETDAIQCTGVCIPLSPPSLLALYGPSPDSSNSSQSVSGCGGSGVKQQYSNTNRDKIEEINQSLLYEGGYQGLTLDDIYPLTHPTAPSATTEAITSSRNIPDINSRITSCSEAELLGFNKYLYQTILRKDDPFVSRKVVTGDFPRTVGDDYDPRTVGDEHRGDEVISPREDSESSHPIRVDVSKPIEGYKTRSSIDLRMKQQLKIVEDADTKDEEANTNTNQRILSLNAKDFVLTKDHFKYLKFIQHIWKQGLSIKIVYSSTPLLEKKRYLFLRSNQEQANEEIIHCINCLEKNNENQVMAKRCLELLQTNTLYICWVKENISNGLINPSNHTEVAQIDTNLFHYLQEKSVCIEDITHIKVGTGRWARCINIGNSVSNKKALVLRVEQEDDVLFNYILTGLTNILLYSRICTFPKIYSQIQ